MSPTKSTGRDCSPERSDEPAAPLSGPYLDVSLSLPILDNFTYSVPDHLQGKARNGSRILVPFGKRVLTGYAVGDREKTDIEGVRDILDVVDEIPLITPPLYELARWMSRYYIASLGMAIKTILPAGLVRESKIRVSLSPDADLLDENLGKLGRVQRAVLGLLVAKSPRNLSGLRRALTRERIRGSVWSAVTGLERRGYIRTEQIIAGDTVRSPTTKIVRLTDRDLPPGKERERLLGRSRRQRECYEWMESVRSPVEKEHLIKRAGFSPRVIGALVEKELLTIEEREDTPAVPEIPGDGFGEGWGTHTPSSEQREAIDRVVEAVTAGRNDVFLLHGVTSSGKTVVYLEVLKQALKQGLSAIVLVPEISLTPQTISRVREVFGTEVSTVHSGLSQQERYGVWMSAREGKTKILVGPRSAVFAPMKNLGVIVIDEEHEPSYKQEDSPRYHARDVAIRRAAIEGAAVVLGSATPSLESYHRARCGEYEMIELPERVGSGTFPDIRVHDMKSEEGRPVISDLLRKEIARRLAKSEQVMLFLNRRGYSSYLQCGSCGWVGQCEQCNISLTLHRRPLRLICHYCDHRQDIPEECPRCNGRDLLFRGMGTERVDREIKELFPEATVERMDLDTTSGKWSHQDILSKFLDGETQILLGTQMIAKGLDFPNVTLVGVVSADTGLNMPDFRAEERAFQLLTQVSGRTGRGEKGGEVIVQTYLSDLPVIDAVRSYDFTRFAERELAQRLEAEYPPAFSLSNIIVQGKDEKEVEEAAVEVSKQLKDIAGDLREATVRIIGPAPCVYTKLRGMYRWHALVKSSDDRAMDQVLSECAGFLSQRKGNVRISIDRDPMTLM